MESWNAVAEDMWGLRASEVQGKNLFALDIGLPLDKLQKVVQRCIDPKATTEEVVVDAVNRRGRQIRCRVSCQPMTDSDANHHGVILLMDVVE